jgi:hypothetical protein
MWELFNTGRIGEEVQCVLQVYAGVYILVQNYFYSPRPKMIFIPSRDISFYDSYRALFALIPVLWIRNYFFLGSGSYFYLNFGSGLRSGFESGFGLFMTNTSEIQII